MGWGGGYDMAEHGINDTVASFLCAGEPEPDPPTVTTQFPLTAIVGIVIGEWVFLQF